MTWQLPFPFPIPPPLSTINCTKRTFKNICIYLYHICHIVYVMFKRLFAIQICYADIKLVVHIKLQVILKENIV